MLPACEFRGDEAFDHKNRPRHKCTHPKMLQGQAFTLVSDSNCMECQYCTFDPAAITKGYRKEKASRVEPAEFERRVSICNECPERKGNYCPILGGCGLFSKLRITSVECPQKRY